MVHLAFAMAHLTSSILSIESHTHHACRCAFAGSGWAGRTVWAWLPEISRIRWLRSTREIMRSMIMGSMLDTPAESKSLEFCASMKHDEGLPEAVGRSGAELASSGFLKAGPAVVELFLWRAVSLRLG